MEANCFIKIIDVFLALWLAQFLELHSVQFFDDLIWHFQEVVTNTINFVIIADEINIVRWCDNIKSSVNF
ncbi:MAG: hypothetical protein BWZ03_00402 [bacterium ADurb.BinA186]|nr:MAG: hypothetical protein BWZ03_00402 [bacterium ADurb.BinA186]